MSTKALFLILFTSVVLATPVFAEKPENDIYGQIQKFTWKEYDAGSRLLEESGHLYGIGYAGKFFAGGLVTIKPRAEIFGGQVDYDGQACILGTATCFPVDSDTDYFGLKMEADIGIKFMAAHTVSVEPFAGLGYRWWRREIDDTTSPFFGPVSGGTERWRILYGRIGIRSDLIASEKVKFIVEGAMKLPIANDETAEDVCNTLGECRDYDLDPGKELSYYAELGMKAGKFKVAFFYEGLRFSESDIVSIGGGLGIFQPESKADIFGLNIGISL